MPTQVDVPLEQLEREVESWMKPLRGSPARRYASRQRFYARYGHAALGNSELAFMRWQERRVLRPAGASPPGSAWWNAVNLRYIYLCQLAVRALKRRVDPARLPPAAQLWVAYVQQPREVTWYRAHNSSIIDGYLTSTHLAAMEPVPERMFLNIVLYRLLFAQAMVEEEPFAFGELGRIFAAPQGPAVNLLTQLSAFYPTTYPMSEGDVRHVMGRCHCGLSAGMQFFDEVLILPELDRLYRLAAGWNRQPGLMQLIRAGEPVYPTGGLPVRNSLPWIWRLAQLRRAISRLFTNNPSPPALTVPWPKK